jgi:hypothetical protein
MSFFWPRHLKSDTTALIRFGRVLHWFLTGVAAICIVSSLVGAPRFPDGSADYLSAALIGLSFAIPIAFIGRGARYILSGE